MDSTLRIEPFDPNQAVWNEWVKRLRRCFRTLKISEDLHVSYLMVAIGREAFDTLRNVIYPENIESFSFEQIVAMMDEVYSPKTTEMEHVHLFRSRKQRQNETPSQFLEALKLLVAGCNYGLYTDKAIRNQFVHGLNDQGVKNKLLIQSELTLVGAELLASTEAKKFSGESHQAPNSTIVPKQSTNPKGTLSRETPQTVPQHQQHLDAPQPETPEKDQAIQDVLADSMLETDREQDQPAAQPKGEEKRLTRIRGKQWKYDALSKPYRYPMWGCIDEDALRSTFSKHAPQLLQDLDDENLQPMIHEEVANIIIEHVFKQYEFLLSGECIRYVAEILVTTFPCLCDPDPRREAEHMFINFDKNRKCYQGLLFAEYEIPQISKSEAKTLAATMTESSEDADIMDTLRFTTRTFHIRRAMMLAKCHRQEILADFPMLLWYNGFILEREFAFNFANRNNRLNLASIYDAWKRITADPSNLTTDENDTSIKCVEAIAGHLKAKGFIIRCKESDVDLWKEKSTRTLPFVVCHEGYSAMIEGVMMRCEEDFDRAFELILKAYAVFVYDRSRLLDFFLYAFYAPPVVFSNSIHRLYSKLFPDE